MSVGRICVREVHVAEPGETALAAARRMRDRRVGTLVVVDEGGKPIGLVTDRDLTVRVVATGRDPQTIAIRDVMTAPPRTVHESTAIEAALSLMRAAAFRRLPVVNDGGTLVGLLGLDDVLGLLAEEFAQIDALVARQAPPRAAAVSPASAARPTPARASSGPSEAG